MKTPEEIKRGLVTCTELVMPADVQHAAMVDALAYIQKLEAENLKLINSYDAALCESADAYEERKEAEAQVPEWISVKEPPEAYSLVNIYTTKKVVDCGYFDGVDWRQYNDEIATQCTIGEVVLWAPTPEPPKEET